MCCIISNEMCLILLFIECRAITNDFFQHFSPFPQVFDGGSEAGRREPAGRVDTASNGVEAVLKPRGGDSLCLIASISSLTGVSM